MCFSPIGDLVVGTVVVAIGVDACRNLGGRTQDLPLATLPLLLGAHQIDEALVWWSLQGRVSAQVGHVAVWIYLLVALVVLPVFVPVALGASESSPRLRRRYVPFAGLGIFVAGVMLETLLVGSPTAELGSHYLAYSIGLQHGVVLTGLYATATCGPLLRSGRRLLIQFGVANLIAVIPIAVLYSRSFASLWCLYAAMVSGVIALRVRARQPIAGFRHS
ncbi:MAG TPA: DUF6629 family protein [Acidimicrobiales bacterium]|nr:DUF6629 family protein [Acidimicrobiales bacterium]